ncbi:MAG: Gfo/Idh/MocA family oxidoreductase [Phycisphaerales bacterium]
MSAPRWGIIGTGRIATGHLPCMLEVGCDVRAIASRDPQRGGDLAKSADQDPEIGCTVDDLLRRDDLDAVYIATPNHLHVEQSIACLRGQARLVRKAIHAVASRGRAGVRGSDEGRPAPRRGLDLSVPPANGVAP